MPTVATWTSPDTIRREAGRFAVPPPPESVDPPHPDANIPTRTRVIERLRTVVRESAKTAPPVMVLLRRLETMDRLDPGTSIIVVRSADVTMSERWSILSRRVGLGGVLIGRSGSELSHPAKAIVFVTWLGGVPAASPNRGIPRIRGAVVSQPHKGKLPPSTVGEPISGRRAVSTTARTPA